MTGTSIPAGNLLLSFGTLTAGTSATKVIRALKHMGMACISLRTYFNHQCVSILHKGFSRHCTGKLLICKT